MPVWVACVPNVSSPPASKNPKEQRTYRIASGDPVKYFQPGLPRRPRVSIACRMCSVCVHRCPLIVFCPPQCVATACARPRSAAWRVVAPAAPKTAPCPSLCVPSPVLVCAVAAACVPPPSGVVCVCAAPATLAAPVTHVPGVSLPSVGRALRQLPFQSSCRLCAPRPTGSPTA